MDSSSHPYTQLLLLYSSTHYQHPPIITSPSKTLQKRLSCFWIGENQLLFFGRYIIIISPIRKSTLYLNTKQNILCFVEVLSEDLLSCYGYRKYCGFISFIIWGYKFGLYYVLGCIIKFESSYIVRMDKEYICGCGKAYGSYPAFSTHRKNKHNNETVPGTKMPSQDKAKRGRPSYDFKKVPRGNVNQAAAFQGLTVIEYGLLELEDKFKGKILSDPTTTIEHELPPTLITKVEQGQSELLEGFISFIKQITNHMTRTIASATITFVCKVIEHGIANNSLHTMHLYNQYFTRSLEEIKNYPLGIEFYIDICVIMTKWLKVLGYTNESLKVKQKKKKQASSLD